MRELSIFIDESGDFGPFEPHAPYYLIALVFHIQSEPIDNEIRYLKQHVLEQGFPEGHAVHSGPLIRRESDYSSLEMGARKKLFRSLFSFACRARIGIKVFSFRKREFIGDHDGLVSRMSRELGSFIRENFGFFQSFERIVVYYDNGQKEITNLINTVFNSLLEVEVKKVRPSDYALFQAADMACTLALLSIKANEGTLTSSEKEFFGGARNLKKNYLKTFEKKKAIPT